MEEKSKKIRIKDVAKLANVSVGTVDRVLHNRGNVNAEKQERVVKILNELGYTPNLLARSLASKKIFKIGVLIPEPYDSNNTYWEQPLMGVKRAIEELRDYNAVIKIHKFNTIDEKSFIKQSEVILKNQYDGIVFVPSFHELSLAFLEKCKEEKIDVMFIDSTIEGADVKSYFGQNAVQSGYLGAKLMSCVTGKESLILILNVANKMAITRHLKKRQEGFLDFINTQGQPDKINTLCADIDISDDREPEKSLARIFSDHPDITGIFVTNARVHQVAKFLCEHNYPKISLGGFDLVAENIPYLNEGIIDFLICQKPEEQGYKTLLAMFHYLQTGFVESKINYSPIDVVFKENVEFYTSVQEVAISKPNS